jgi:hypothetical protein
VRFITKIYHPNIDKLGRICLDILKGKEAGSQSYDSGIHNYNASVVVGSSIFSNFVENVFVFKTHWAARGVLNFFEAGDVTLT